QIAPPTKNGHAPPPIESRKSSQSETLSKSAVQQPDSTNTGKATFGDFISSLDGTPSFSKIDAPTPTAPRPEGKQPTSDNATEKSGKEHTSFAGLFSTNRRLTDENKLSMFELDDGPLTLEPNDMLDVRSKLGFCLVGYIAGKFPGLKAIRALSQSWGSSFQQHESGWLIFRFAREQDRQRILSGGPYFIYGRPLLLKHMPDCFEFKEDDISLTPVWATLPSLPLECWHPNALGKIGSKIGNPIAMDSLTLKMERVSYARILVEFIMPNGITRKQPVAYEFTPKFCTECNRFGHLKETCHGTPPSAATAAAAPTTAPAVTAAAALANAPAVTAAAVPYTAPAMTAATAPATEWTMVQRRKKGKSSDVTTKPTVEDHQPIPLAITTDKERTITNGTHSSKLQDNEATTLTESDNSSTNSPTANFMPGINSNEPVRVFSKPVKQTGGEGFNRPLKHNGVAHLIKHNRLCLLGILETKLAASKIQAFLADHFRDVIDLQPEDFSPQVIHCRATNKSSQLSFYISFCYGLYSVVNRRSMWEKLTDLGKMISIPWLIMGDFNCVKSPEEKQLGVTPTWYELKDFVDCCAALGLLDVPTTGCYYTWYSNNESNPVWCKLDRVLHNNEWLEAGLHCGAHFNPSGCLSDHSPGIVTIFDHTPTKPKPFRFFNMWAEYPEFLSTVEQRWNLHRLKALKAELKAFNMQHYIHISTRAKEADLALQDAQNQLENNPKKCKASESLGDLKRKAVFLAEAERNFFYQKAKIHYLKEGDRNTKFFHDMVKRNAARNSITAVTRADGTIITSADAIAQEFVDYYTTLLGTESHTIPVDDGVFDYGPKLSSELTDELYREVTAMEVKDAIFNINDNKAPGPDGYSSCFFKKAWNVVADQSIPLPLLDYRPISCCNVIYKAITKIISDRLAPALEHLIDHCQSAFIGGRNITDNIFLAQEMVRQYSRKRISPRCTINIDLRKAYDSVSWTFLSRVLHGYGFPPLFIAWIMECVCTSSFFCIFEWFPTRILPGEERPTARDPMSPALFLLSMEYLSRMIKRKTCNSDFNYHPKCEKLKITHLLFADDLMLFFRGDLPSIHILMECLNVFRDASGLSVKTSKSCIFTAGIRNEELDEILARTAFVRGRLELVRSVIQGVECFWLQVFPLPAVVIEKIHRLCRNFLWNSRRAPVAWEEICHPKEEGGLGIQHIQSWNVALLARVLWNIHRKADTLWVQWVNGVYLRDASIWDWQPKKGDSPLLQRLAEIRDRMITEFGSSEAAIEQMTRWSTLRGLQTSKAYEYFRPKLARQPWKAAILKAFIPPKYSFINVAWSAQQIGYTGQTRVPP
ncbi:UNVERIFIED_CONTAM: Retrovirus-related Pol polyprotein from type-2 retrotransposable element R2DM, partial [Sesamum indicum]